MHAPTAGCTNSDIPKCGKHTCVHTHTQTETYAHTSGSWHSLYICVRCKHRDGVSSDSCLSDVDCRVCRVFTWKKHSWLPQCAVQSGETDRRKNSMRNVKKHCWADEEEIQLNKQHFIPAHEQNSKMI